MLEKQKKIIKKETKNMKQNNGITLIALVITIIVLIILAGISISLVLGENGILTKSRESVIEHKKAKAKEEVEFAWASIEIEYYENMQSSIGLAKEKVFTIKNLNKYLRSTGKVSDLIYNEKGTSTLKYLSKADYIKYNMEIDENGNVNIIGEGTPVDPNTLPKEYAVVYDINGGIGNIPEKIDYEEGTTVTVDFTTLPTREGYKFIGWATSSTATEAIYTSEGTKTFIMGNSELKLYAIWEETKYAVIYNVKVIQQPQQHIQVKV